MDTEDYTPLLTHNIHLHKSQSESQIEEILTFHDRLIDHLNCPYCKITVTVNKLFTI